MRGGIPLLHSNNYGIYFVVKLRQFELHQFQDVIPKDCPSVPTVIRLLRPRGNFMYRKFIHLQNTNTASQCVCVFLMMIKTNKKYKIC